MLVRGVLVVPQTPAAALAHPRQRQEMPQHCAPATCYEVELQAIEDYRRFAATTIQRVFRGWIVRLHRAREASLRQQQQAAAASQGPAATRVNRAARCIQDAWRCFRNKRVFALFKATIAFSEGCDPRQVLRCISAREAQLVEPAAGLHVRLRLAGAGFPPVLVYKLFTHRPVTDICAFGPRDYAAEAAAKRAAEAAAKRAAATGAETAEASGSTTTNSSMRGWYQRDDRNGWRPVVELQQMPGEPPLLPFSRPSGSGSSRRKPVALHRISSHRCRVKKQHCRRASTAGSGNSWSETAAPGQQQRDGGAAGSQGGSSTYHHSPLVRRAERARRLKHRRRQWLLKMYRVGMQQQQQQQQRAGQAAPAAVCEVSSSSSSSASREELLLQQLERQLLRRQQQPASDASSSNSTAAQEGDASDLEQLLSLGLDASILAWAHRLDFDAWYQAHWSATAVTLGSEAAVPVPLREQLLQAARLAS